MSSLFDLPDYLPAERNEARHFWYTRYHHHAENPVRMSPTGQPEGGFGMWDASVHARKLMAQSLTDKSLAVDLRDFAEAPESSLHPVSAAYLQRRQGLERERQLSCGADKERLDLLLRAEARAYQNWTAQEHFQSTPCNPAAGRTLERTEREKDQAFTALFDYDRRHGHPLTDPNRNLAKDPPDVSERRAWLVDRENLAKGTARRFDRDNEAELQGLGMQPQAWMDAQAQKEFARIAPRHSGKVVPTSLEQEVARRQKFDQATQTHRNPRGAAVGKRQAFGAPGTLGPAPTAKVVAPVKASNRPPRMGTQQELLDTAARSNRQGSELVRDTRTSQDAVALPMDTRALPELLQERRAAAVASAPAQTRRPSLGQTVASVTPERAHAEKVAQRFGERHAQSGRIDHAKLADPARMERTLALRKQAPKPTPQARQIANRPVRGEPGTPSFLQAIQARASAFTQAMGQKWDRSLQEAKAHMKAWDKRLDKAIHKADRAFESKMAKLEEHLPWGGATRQERVQQEQAAASARRAELKPRAMPPTVDPAPTAERAAVPQQAKIKRVNNGPLPNPNAAFMPQGPQRSLLMDINVPSAQTQARAPQPGVTVSREQVPSPGSPTPNRPPRMGGPLPNPNAQPIMAGLKPAATIVQPSVSQPSVEPSMAPPSAPVASRPPRMGGPLPNPNALGNALPPRPALPVRDVSRGVSMNR